jgi:S1-C subfamily serine protease
MYCKSCGDQLKKGIKFCTKCGVAVPSVISAPVQPEAVGLSKKKIAAIVFGVLILIIVVAALASSNGQKTDQASNNLTQEQQNAALQDNARAVVNVLCDNNGGGSGTIFTKEGEILTNNHVIENASYCLVTLPDPATGYAARIYHAKPLIVPTYSSQYDIAILSIDGSHTDKDGKTWGDYPTTFPTFTTPSTCNPNTPSQLNDSVRIYGYPVTSGGYNLTVTDGIISSFTDDGRILTSAKIDSGNSGGLAIDQYGCFIGIPSAVESGNYQNLGVIIPNNIIKEFFAEASSSPLVEAPQKTKNQVCQDSFGVNSQWSGSTNNVGKPTCNCRSGYSWDASGDACASQTSLDQECQNRFGSGSHSVTDNGKAVCDCAAGYSWNSDQTACTAVLTPDQVCQRDIGGSSYYLGYKNADGTYACSNSY